MTKTTDDKPRAKTNHHTNPEQRKRARWLAGLWKAKQPQYAAQAIAQAMALPEAQREDALRNLPEPTPRATRAEFFAAMRLNAVTMPTDA